MNNTKLKPMAAVVDYETGEIIDELCAGDRVLHDSPEQRELKEKYHLNFNKREEFVKVFTSTLMAVNKELTTKEGSVLLEIIPFISYSDGVLRYNNQIVDLKELSELNDENYDVFRRTISSLIKRGIIAKTKVTSDNSKYVDRTCYVVNPYIFFKGTNLERRFGYLFEDTKWKAVKDKIDKTTN